MLMGGYNMKKWLKIMSMTLVFTMMFCLAGSIGVNAARDDDDDSDRITDLRVTYDGDPVPYRETISKSDFDVEIKTKGSRSWHDADDFDIDPDTMDSERSVTVTVTVECPYTGKDWTKRVKVECAEPELESIEARYMGDDLLVNGVIDKDDVRVEAFYDNGSSKYVDDWTFGSYRLRDGDNNVVIYYRENGVRESAEITVYAYEGELSYISAYYNGGAVTVGSRIDNSKIKVSGIYTEKGYGNITQTLSGWTLENYSIKEGNNTIRVIYNEKGKQFTDTITVKGVAAGSSNPGTNTNAGTAAANGTWVQVGGSWKYQLKDKSYQINSWIQSPETSKWYFVDANGNMIDNRWVQVNGNWYFMNQGGAMATGWKQVDAKWYFLNEKDGNMETGWKYYNNQWYYLTPGSGEMATNRWINNWYVDSNGVWTQTR